MRPKPDERALACQEYYRVLISALRYRAYRCGYALGVHGSLKRDIDLIAAPWRDGAVDAYYLVDALRKITEEVIGMARVRDIDRDRQPERKPCGRLGWSFYLTPMNDGPYLDISVMPKGKTRKA